jgi:Tol biopolymer transport system component
VRCTSTCAKNVRVRRFLIFASICCAPVTFAQRAAVRDGNIVFVDHAGHERQITNTGKDYEPSLSANGESVVFVRQTKVASYPSQPKEMQVLESELWLADTSGRQQPRAIFHGFVMPPDGRPLTSFFGPQVSPDGRYVYFLAEFSATSHALCRWRDRISSADHWFTQRADHCVDSDATQDVRARLFVPLLSARTRWSQSRPDCG